MFNSDIINYVLNIDFENNIKNIKSYYTKISKLVNKNKNIKISRHTISNWIKNKNLIFKNRLSKEILKNHKINPLLLYKGYKLNKINLDLVLNYINIFPLASRNDIRLYIFNDFKISLSLNTITKFFKKLNLTRKKINFQIIKNMDYVKELNLKRENYISYFKNKYLNKLIFIDEVGFNLSKLNSNKKGLSLKGNPIYMPDKTKCMNNLNIIMSINNYSIFKYSIYDKSIDSFKFYDFIDEIINILKEDNYIFIFDNVSFHHNKNMLNLIKNNNHSYYFTPPYSPNYNPIENVFGIIKNIYKNKYKNINLSTTKFSLKEHINIIEESINDFISIYSIDLDKIINRALNYSYDKINKECIMRYK